MIIHVKEKITLNLLQHYNICSAMPLYEKPWKSKDKLNIKDNLILHDSGLLGLFNVVFIRIIYVKKVFQFYYNITIFILLNLCK